jgi:hypothetical protein
VNIPFRTGVNMREFAYYGTPSAPHTRLELQSAQVNELRALGVQVIRLFGVCRRLSIDDNVRRLKAALDLLHRSKMQAIIALNDAFGSEWTIPQEASYHREVMGHLHKDYWLYRQYRAYYIPYVRRVVGALVGHPALLLWELGNEFAIHPQPATPPDERAFYNFAAEASAVIKQITPATLVSTGLINTNQVTTARTREEAARRLYRLATIDAISIHFYAEDGEVAYANTDVLIAHDFDKPFYVGEMGADITKMSERSGWYADQFGKWRGAGAFTIMPWAFDTSPIDVGVSDTRAFARIYGDYGGLRSVVAQHATNAPAYRPLPPGARRFRVALGPLSVRVAPAITSQRLELLAVGDEIDVDEKSRTEAGGYIWWKHYGKQQWTAEKRLIDNVIYMTAVSV